eukprot:scaffold15401_cov98-Isochrysis_galbana.AAC.1
MLVGLASPPRYCAPVPTLSRAVRDPPPPTDIGRLLAWTPILPVHPFTVLLKSCRSIMSSRRKPVTDTSMSPPPTACELSPKRFCATWTRREMNHGCGCVWVVDG